MPIPNLLNVLYNLLLRSKPVKQSFKYTRHAGREANLLPIYQYSTLNLKGIQQLKSNPNAHSSAIIQLCLRSKSKI